MLALWEEAYVYSAFRVEKKLFRVLFTDTVTTMHYSPPTPRSRLSPRFRFRLIPQAPIPNHRAGDRTAEHTLNFGPRTLIRILSAKILLCLG